MKFFTVMVFTLMFILSVWAETSSTIVAVSDYLFNGVSQTDDNPALQISFDWVGDRGMYAGV